MTIDVPDSLRTYRVEELPIEWRATGSSQPLPSQTFLLDWSPEPGSLVVQVPSSIVSILANYLINPRHSLFWACKVIDSAPFEIDERLYDPARRSV